MFQFVLETINYIIIDYKELKKDMITQTERQHLRDLAQRQLEIAYSPKNSDRISLWKRHHAFTGERPVIHIEIDTFAQEIITPRMQCISPEARRLEYDLYHNFLNMELFDDDKVVPDYFAITWNSYFHLFGTDVKKTCATDSNGGNLGHHFEYNIYDLEQDWDKIYAPTTFGVDEAKSLRYQHLAEDVFGDILPTRLVMNGLYAVPTQEVVHRMGMETMFCSMYDYPDQFKQMMDKIADAYLAYFDMLEKKSYLLPTVGFESLGQGSMCFTQELPDHTPLTTKQVWGFLDSQETVGVSPDMFGEFIFPCYQKIANKFGLLSYGCCEPVDPVWKYVKTLPNLRKVSISPWCNQTYMAEQLKGKKTIFHRKPSPNYLGVGNVLDEQAFRAHIEETLNIAKGCKVEITQRDVYTVAHNEKKVKRYVEIIRESIENCWE